MTPLPSPAETAAAEFRRRRAAWQRVGAGQPSNKAEANLRLWLAIACAAGSQLDELEWFRPERVFPLKGDPSASSSPAVGQDKMPILLDWIAPRDQWQAALLRARDTLLARAWHPDATAEQRTRAAAVAALAHHLRCSLHRDQPEERPGASNPERKAA